ncbi:molybdenum cofactor biosynthesis protein MoaE [Parapedobacter sp. 2B3]|uniref:molybdenum cofactor biosynthesis protein MoaE n=1 Tax=Parapedobacter sp. 2B3 TaxID=3342381 RepID=UPI0035B6534E
MTSKLSLGYFRAHFRYLDKKMVNTSLFVDGPITKVQLGRFLHQDWPDVESGSIVVFQGWVQTDVLDGKAVAAINYTAHRDMGEQRLAVIKRELLSMHPNSTMVVKHSLGRVHTGECFFFVKVVAPRRATASSLCKQLVNRIKAELPILGEPAFEGGSYQVKGAV